MKKTNIALSATISMDPIISINEHYLNAIWNEGAVPSVLYPSFDDTYIKDICDRFDGFIFSGGEDIDPSYYGEEKSKYIKNICTKRDKFEEKLFKSVFKTGKPILGICRGMQIINVFLGGSLHQHIEGHVQNAERDIRTHNVDIVKGSLLWSVLCRREVAVNSFHHQAVKRLAPELCIDALSAQDRYVESFHHEKHPFLLCVQWHPESYYGIDVTSNKIFNCFISACKNKREWR